MFYRVLGMMSGTSLDGLDLALCEFDIDEKQIDYQIIRATTIPYASTLKDKILRCENCNGEYLAEFSAYLGHYFGKQANKFLKQNNLTADFIASHGQTIFHQPHKGFTLQIGDINAIASETELTVIGDFRSMDVALNGQGAPLVPIGDKLLFANYDCCLNIGGFSNIPFDDNSLRKAYDICPSNIVLNYLCHYLNLEYDNDGQIAKHSTIDTALLQELNSIPYYTNNEQQSLGKEFVKQYIFPLLENSSLSIECKIATYTEHIAYQIGKNIKGKTLVTGGGAYNSFLIDRIRHYANYELIVPSNLIVEYKEALIFAFLGVRRLRKEVNCLSSVTGARCDSCSGSVVYWLKE